jgi:hypothetical protein
VRKVDAVIVVSGQVDAGEMAGQVNVKVIARDILSLTEAVESRTETISLKIPRSKLDTEALSYLQDIVKTFPGPTQTYLKLGDRDGESIYRLQSSLKPCRELIESAQKFLGPRGLELR